ncbi:MAG TPA: hypothetical protein VEO53_03285 [Candidatus Binatia bacterium]|nr:hypothetical protein [Candidatus Binatia bacterium]
MTREQQIVRNIKRIGQPIEMPERKTSRPFAQEPPRPIQDAPCGIIYSRRSMDGDLIEMVELATLSDRLH